MIATSPALYPRVLSPATAHRLQSHWKSGPPGSTPLRIASTDTPVLFSFLNGMESATVKAAFGHAGISVREQIGHNSAWLLASVQTLAVPALVSILHEIDLGLAADFLDQAWTCHTTIPSTKRVPLPQGRSLELKPGRTVVMGVVNVTPDSFFAGSRTEDATEAVARGLALRAAGAEVLDIGGESTRPGAPEVPADEELQRVVPVIRQLREADPEGVLSIDTRKAPVAKAAIEAGADLINDVTGGKYDPEILTVAAESGAGLALMHMQGTPETMQSEPVYEDVVAEVSLSLWGAARVAVRAGVPKDRIFLDPGIGFGKRLEHNLALLEGMDALRGMGFPILLGTSRKSFLGSILKKDDPAERLIGTLATVAVAAWQGVEMVRVHDADAAQQVTRVVEAIAGAMPVPGGAES